MALVSEKNINICSDPILKNRLARQGIEAHVFDMILSREKKTKILESLEKFASNWFLTESGVDYTEYKNISIGAAIHDEVRTLFYLLIYFVFILDKLKSKNEIIFYHSTSCLMPDIVIKFLSLSNVRIKLIEEKYPWLSFKEQLDSQAKANFSRISFNFGEKKYQDIRSILGQIKLGLKQILSRIFGKIFQGHAKNIYFHANRSLISFYKTYLNNEKNDFGLYITDTTPLIPKTDKKRSNICNDLILLFQLARQGIILDSLKCPFYYKWYINYQRKVSYKKLVVAFQQQFLKDRFNNLNIKDTHLLEYFTQTFSRFYLNHLVKFIKLIDFYYKKFTNINVNLCLQEMCHPFQAQVLASIGIPCRIYPSNHILHNQYFAPIFFKKIKHFIKPVAISNLDAERFSKLGFDRDNIQTLDPSFFSHWSNKIMPFHKIKSLNKKKILILAPTIIAMNTFRYQVQSEKLYGFFSDIFGVLSELRVSSVTIRPHPGADVQRNQFGYTDNDILKYLVNKVEDKYKRFKISFSNSYFYNLENDILDNDIIIANLTGALFETLIFGRDYIYFDDTITPYYGTKDWSIFNEGTIKKLRTKEEFRNHLINYNPPNLESLRNKLFENILPHNNGNKDLNPFALF